ncbi:MAG TPA: DUF4363 family protein [Oscillospiraceae bacterium]|nr:DUF4363 family protein [Oscillospiraceae bacterium]
MKRLWISLAILALVFAVSYLNTLGIAHITDQLVSMLEEAEALAPTDHDAALEKTEEAFQLWQDSAGYLYTVLFHSDSDQVRVLFAETLEYLRSNETGGEYAACSAALRAQIELLSEMEELSLTNIL